MAILGLLGKGLRFRAVPSAMFVCVALTACGVEGIDSPLQVEPPFSLFELLEDDPVTTRGALGVELRMKVRDGSGTPVPYALIQFDWEDGGRTAFQSDVEGDFWIRFPDLESARDARVSLRTIAIGEEFVVADYDELSSELVDGTVAVLFGEYVPSRAGD